MLLVKLENLVKRYPIGKTVFTALHNFNLSFEKGEFSGVVGPSGSGKTTLLNIVGSLDMPSEGSAVVMGENIEHQSHKQTAVLRSRHMGFNFQTCNQLPVYTAFENVEFPLLIMKMPEKERKKKVWDALEWLGITDKAYSRPAQLSGGESQRVAVARAVVKRPDLVLADEPTANLDAENSYNMLEMMVRLNQELMSTFIFATHDEKVIKYMRRKISLVDGRVVKDEVTN